MRCTKQKLDLNEYDTTQYIGTIKKYDAPQFGMNP